MKKLICGFMVVMSITFVPIQASAGFLSDLGGGLLGDLAVDGIEHSAKKSADKILVALWKSAVLMEESKLCIAEALEMNPREIAASKEALRAMTLDHKDMNAIRKSIRRELPESELQSKTAKLMTITDRTKLEQLSKLLKRSKDARSAAHSYNSDAIGHILSTIGHIAVLHELDPAAEDRIMGYFLSRIMDSRELLDYQKQQSKMFHQTFSIVERKMNIKEPSKKEIKKIEKELLPQ